MPVIQIHLTDGAFSTQQLQSLLSEASLFFAETLSSPVERVRAFITLHRPELCAIGALPVNLGGAAAPFFTVIVLEGRPVEQRQRLLTGLTDIIERVLSVPRQKIRGVVTAVHPDDWSIGGVPASSRRQNEIHARYRT